MKDPVTDPKQQFEVFDRIMSQYLGFTRKPVPGSGYKDWEQEGMHDPPGPGRVYSIVRQRVVFTTQDLAANFRVQLDLLDRRGKSLAAVFIRSEDFPKKALNTANATFKFKWDQRHQAYVMDLKSQAVRRWLSRPGSVPPYIQRDPVRQGRVILGPHLDASLVHKLLLVTDYAGQCDHGSVRPRNPAQFRQPQ
ncbi:MAG: hypothetical protein IPM17_11090 [Verrucomicrobia bacterium]|nr:hypothetical protein [Verrucomicrobiota bacterium]